MATKNEILVVTLRLLATVDIDVDTQPVFEKNINLGG